MHFVHQLQGVYGQIKDVRGRPLMHAKVTLDGTTTLRLRDHRATFSASLAEGAHTLTFELADYETKTVRVRVGPGDRKRKNVVLDSIFGDKIEFREPDAVRSYVEELARKYPGQARAYTVGSRQGRPMAALEISGNLRQSHVKPGVRVLGGVRGREMVGTQVALALAEFLLSHAQLDDEIGTIVDTYSIHVVPLVDREGAAGIKAGDCGLEATSGRDLELDYGAGVTTQGRPETRALLEWFEQRSFIISLNLGGSDEDITIPKKHNGDDKK